MRNFSFCNFSFVDLKKEEIAIKEAKKLNIPIIGIVDTNCDPDMVDYVIPGNDDAIRAIKYISSVMADAVIEGREGEQGTVATKDKVEDTKSEPSVEADTKKS